MGIFSPDLERTSISTSLTIPPLFRIFRITCLALSGLAYSLSTERPRTSDALYPKSFSAAELKILILPRVSVVTTISAEFLIILRRYVRWLRSFCINLFRSMSSDASLAKTSSKSRVSERAVGLLPS